MRNDAGAMISNGNISIESDDVTSGVAKIYYSIDWAAYKTYSSPIKLMEENSYYHHPSTTGWP